MFYRGEKALLRGLRFSRIAHAKIAIDHRSSRIRETVFCSAKPAPYSTRAQRNHPAPSTGEDAAHIRKTGEIAMQTILSALVALSLIAGVAGSASALDAKTFYEQVDRNHY